MARVKRCFAELCDGRVGHAGAPELESGFLPTAASARAAGPTDGTTRPGRNQEWARSRSRSNVSASVEAVTGPTRAISWAFSSCASCGMRKRYSSQKPARS